ncbi:MAG: hypothetical protein ABUS48_00895 [Pseudomonadota bacterium]
MSNAANPPDHGQQASEENSDLLRGVPENIGAKINTVRVVKGHCYVLWHAAPSFTDMLAVNAAWAEIWKEPIEHVEHFVAQWIAGADFTREFPL